MVCQPRLESLSLNLFVDGVNSSSSGFVPGTGNPAECELVCDKSAGYDTQAHARRQESPEPSARWGGWAVVSTERRSDDPELMELFTGEVLNDPVAAPTKNPSTRKYVQHHN